MASRTSRALICASLVGAGYLGTSSHALAAQAFNVDFNSNNANTYSGTAAGTYDSGTFWNGMSDNTSALTLKDSTGATSAVSMTLAGGTRFFDATGGTTPNPTLLMEDYRVLDTNSAATGGALATVTLTGVTDGTYKIYIYAAGDTAGQGANLAVAAANQTSSGVSSGATTGGNRDVTSTANLGISYFVLDAVVSDPSNSGTGTITFTASNLTGQRFSGLNGFQLQAVPEPASLCVASAISFGMLLRRRKKS